MATLHSRSIAAHLSTFASLLEAEAIRANTLGLKGVRDLTREAMEVRHMANQLWDADTAIAVCRPPALIARRIIANDLQVCS
jgi:hypothetical protein